MYIYIYTYFWENNKKTHGVQYKKHPTYLLVAGSWLLRRLQQLHQIQFELMNGKGLTPPAGAPWFGAPGSDRGFTGEEFMDFHEGMGIIIPSDSYFSEG